MSSLGTLAVVFGNNIYSKLILKSALKNATYENCVEVIKYLFLFHLYVCVYECFLYVSVCLCVYVLFHDAFVCLCIWMFLYVSVCLCVYVCVSMGTCLFLFVHVCMYVYVCVWWYVHAYVYYFQIIRWSREIFLNYGCYINFIIIMNKHWLNKIPENYFHFKF